MLGNGVSDAVACTTEQTQVGEGVRWDARRDELLRVDILAGRVYHDRVDDAAGLVPVRTPRSPGPWARLLRSRATRAAGRGFVHLSPEGSLHPLAEVSPEGTRMNDAACDPRGPSGPEPWLTTAAREVERSIGSIGTGGPS